MYIEAMIFEIGLTKEHLSKRVWGKLTDFIVLNTIGVHEHRLWSRVVSQIVEALEGLRTHTELEAGCCERKEAAAHGQMKVGNVQLMDHGFSSWKTEVVSWVSEGEPASTMNELSCSLTNSVDNTAHESKVVGSLQLET